MSVLEFAVVLARVLLLLGGAIAVVGAIGLNRFPEAYTRAHAGTMVTVGGVLFGLACLFVVALANPTVPPGKIALIMLVIAIGAPASTHAVFRAATRKNVRPFIAWRNDMRERMKE